MTVRTKHTTEYTIRSKDWPRMFCGEIITNLATLPGILIKDEYKDSHML